MKQKGGGGGDLSSRCCGHRTSPSFQISSFDSEIAEQCSLPKNLGKSLFQPRLKCDCHCISVLAGMPQLTLRAPSSSLCLFSSLTQPHRACQQLCSLHGSRFSQEGTVNNAEAVPTLLASQPAIVF